MGMRRFEGRPKRNHLLEEGVGCEAAPLETPLGCSEWRRETAYWLRALEEAGSGSAEVEPYAR